MCAAQGGKAPLNVLAVTLDTHPSLPVLSSPGLLKRGHALTFCAAFGYLAHTHCANPSVLHPDP